MKPNSIRSYPLLMDSTIQNIFISKTKQTNSHKSITVAPAHYNVSKIFGLVQKFKFWRKKSHKLGSRKKMLFVYFRKLNSLYIVYLMFLLFLPFYLIDNYLAQLSIARAILSNSLNYVTLGVSSIRFVRSCLCLLYHC